MQIETLRREVAEAWRVGVDDTMNAAWLACAWIVPVVVAYWACARFA